MALTETAVRTAKATNVDRKMADEKGLYLLVTASGSKLWRLKYRIDGKEKKLALGSYPEVGLKEARNRRDSARKAAETARDLWVPGVNALGGFGRWAYAEFTDWTVMDEDFAVLVERLRSQIATPKAAQ